MILFLLFLYHLIIFYVSLSDIILNFFVSFFNKNLIMSSIRKFNKNYENPFIKQALEQINNNIVKKYKSATKTGQSAILQAMDPNTGELVGHTQFIRQIEVDEEQFTKIYLSQFSAFWNLNTQAIRVFGYIMTKLVPKQDMFIFLMEECLTHTNYKNHRSVHQGLSALLEADIIARGPADTLYFINPMIAFNGDRVTFAKTYVKKKSPGIPKNQGSLNFDNPADPYVLPEVNPIDSF